MLRNRTSKPKRGVALLITLFVIATITVWLVDMLDTSTTYQSALRNTIEYEQALYLANAGVHHAAAMLEADQNWNSTVSGTGYYTGTPVDPGDGTLIITSYGTAGEVTRKIQATFQVN